MAAPPRANLLIVDDDPEILGMLRLRLGAAGYQVTEASDGVQALVRAHAHRPDVILLDVMMPGKNGWEVARELRQSTELAKVGIIMLTAIGEKMNQMTSPLYGADDFLDKPFQFDELERKIEAVLAKRRAPATR
jgi:DNA-binding response OmpR family regulator